MTEMRRQFRYTIFYGGKGGVWGSDTVEAGYDQQNAEKRAADALRTSGVRVVVESREVSPWEQHGDSGPAPVGCIDCSQTGNLPSGRKCPTCKGKGSFVPDD